MASDFHSVADRRLQRCIVGYECGPNCADPDISFSELETAGNDRSRRLRVRASNYLNRNSLSSTLRTALAKFHVSDRTNIPCPTSQHHSLADLIVRF